MGNRTRNLVFMLNILLILTIFGLAGWWMYLIMNLGESVPVSPKIVNMIKWEGAAFFLFLLTISVSLFYFYFLNIKRSISLQKFFSSLTHELKTPLASIRLQADVIKDFQNEKKSQKGTPLLNRLVEDTLRLEDELDKILQLSRIERNGHLSLVTCDLEKMTKEYLKEYETHDDLEFVYESQELLPKVSVDQFALKVIIRNLVENTKKHNNKQCKIIKFNFETDNKSVVLKYSDNGSMFKGKITKLGGLFYKYNSPGSGIGVYLIKRLMKKMKGGLKISNSNTGPVFILRFTRDRC